MSSSTSGIGASSQVGAYTKAASNVTPPKKDQNADFSALLGLGQDDESKKQKALPLPNNQPQPTKTSVAASGAYAPVDIKV